MKASEDPLAGKRLVIIGLARQGKALARFAAENGAEVVVLDLRSVEQMAPALKEMSDVRMEVILGEHPESVLDGADMLAISGGVSTDAPLVQSARARGIRITNDSLEFMLRTPATVIGVTGSAGKTTTTALTGAIVRESGKRTWIGGNIGNPLISRLPEMQPGDVAVQELSSFQLELWDCSPPIAGVLNITPNHLDRHRTMTAYRAAKANILRHQTQHDVAVLSADDPEALSLQSETPGRVRLFSLRNQVDDGAYCAKGRIWLSSYGEPAGAVCDVKTIRLRGQHNILNVLAAVTLADSAGVDIGSMRRAIAGFTGVEHRLELVDTLNGVQYFNDSIATAPERALAAIDSFTEPIVLLAGGRDKDLKWGEWVRTVNRSVKAVVLFGALAPLLEKLMEEDLEGRKLPNRSQIVRVGSLDEALPIAAGLAAPGDVVLLAPGGTSFDAYEDFAARGAAFRALVASLKASLAGNSLESETSS